MTMKLPNCDFCKHYHTDEEREWCDAFPNGIPLEIMVKAAVGVECADGYSYDPIEDEVYGGSKKEGFLGKMIDIVGND